MSCKPISKDDVVFHNTTGYMRWRIIPLLGLEQALCSKQGASIAAAVFGSGSSSSSSSSSSNSNNAGGGGSWCLPTNRTVIEPSAALRGRPEDKFRSYSNREGYVLAVAVHAQRGNDNVMVLVSSGRAAALADWPLPNGQLRDHIPKPVLHAPELLNIDRALFIITCKDDAPSWAQDSSEAPHQIKDIVSVFHGLRHVVLFDDDDAELALDGPGLWRSADSAHQSDVPLETGLRVAYTAWAMALAFRPAKLPVMNPSYYNARLKLAGPYAISVGQACVEILQRPQASDPVLMITTLSSRWGNALWWVDRTSRMVAAVHANILRLCIIRMPRIHQPVMQMGAAASVEFCNITCAIDTLSEIFTTRVFLIRGTTAWTTEQRLMRMPSVADPERSDPTANRMPPPPRTCFATMPPLATDRLALFRCLVSSICRRRATTDQYPSGNLTSIPHRIGIGDRWMYTTTTLSGILAWFTPAVTCPAHGIPGGKTARVPRLSDSSGWGVQQHMPKCLGVDGQPHAAGRLALVRRVYGPCAHIVVGSHLSPGGKSDEEVRYRTRIWAQTNVTPEKDNASWVAKESILKMIRTVEPVFVQDVDDYDQPDETDTLGCPAGGTGGACGAGFTVIDDGDHDGNGDDAGDDGDRDDDSLSMAETVAQERTPHRAAYKRIRADRMVTSLDLASRHLAFAIQSTPRLVGGQDRVGVPDTYPGGRLSSMAIIGGVPLAGVVFDEPCHCGMITFLIAGTKKRSPIYISDTVVDSMGTRHCRDANGTGVDVGSPARLLLQAAIIRGTRFAAKRACPDTSVGHANNSSSQWVTEYGCRRTRRKT
jgi:hypothetical protein